MTNRPILFSAPMIRALLAGRKKQTRRVLANGETGEPPTKSPRFAVGDRLYVRELWRTGLAYDDLPPAQMGGDEPIRYEVDGNVEAYGGVPERGWGRLRQGMHMPRWASRLTLTVTDVRVQRLQDISESDAVAEGCFKGKASGRVFESEASMHLGGEQWCNAREWYADLWDRLNADRGFEWDADPWIVAVSFTVQRRNIDEAA